MKFYGTPKMLVNVKNLKPLRQFRFDSNGEYGTENPRVIARLKKRFKYEELVTVEVKEEDAQEVTKVIEGVKEFECKKCDYKTSNKGELLAHYRTAHKKE